MHAIWRLLLDDDLVEAYMDGILIECADSIVRRLFPAFSATQPITQKSANLD